MTFKVHNFVYKKYTNLCMQKYTKMFIFELYTFCVLYVHKFVYVLCVHIDVYSNVYLLYTISTRVYVGWVYVCLFVLCIYL